MILTLVSLSALSRHVEHPDHGVVSWCHQLLLVPVVVGHGGDGEALRVGGEAGLGELDPLLEQVVVVRSRRLVIIPWAVVVISDVIVVIIVWTVWASKSFSVDIINNIFVGL